jgi:hypothetical protein
MTANQQSAGPAANKRAANAMIMEDWLQKNRVKYNRRINNALQYAGVLGRGKRYAEQWANQHPDALSDYDWYKGIFRTSLVNNINLMEGMASTDQQRKELQGAIGRIDKLSTNPVRARKEINKTIDTLQDISDSVFNIAEPHYKGVYRRANHLVRYKGNYISTPQPAEPTVLMQDPHGQYWNVPQSKVQQGIQMGYRRAG